MDELADALAVYRLARLVTTDALTRPLRAAVIRSAYGRANGMALKRDRWSDIAAEQQVMLDDDPPLAAKLVTCMSCASVWAALGVIAARRLAPGLWAPLGRALALSGATVLVGDVRARNSA